MVVGEHAGCLRGWRESVYDIHGEIGVCRWASQGSGRTVGEDMREGLSHVQVYTKMACTAILSTSFAIVTNQSASKKWKS